MHRSYLTPKPHLHALKKIGTARQIFGTVLTILRHGTPNFRRVNVSGIGPRLPPGGSLGTGKRGTVPQIWRAVLIF